MGKAALKGQIINFANNYLNGYEGNWEGYDDALDFAQDGATLSLLILEYFCNED